MTEHRYTLEPYKTPASRYDCPGCGKRKIFSRYLDTETGEHLYPSVGRCNREVNCGYHYTPKQYFQGNNISFDTTQLKQLAKIKQARTPEPMPVSFIPFEVFEKSLQHHSENIFVKFLCSLFGTEITNRLIEKYYLGTSKHWNGATVFWQIDISGKRRTGKIIQYEIINEEKSVIGLNCKRVKTNIPPVQWAHKLLKVEDYNLQQCFFGEHLLQDNTKPVAIFEGEKTAGIASVYFPDYLCLGCGGLAGLSTEKCKVLRRRSVILFPDISKPDAKVNCFEDWSNKAKELSRLFPGTRFKISDLLECKANETEREQGLDLADYLIRFDYREFQQREQPEHPQQTFEQPQRNEIQNPGGARNFIVPVGNNEKKLSDMGITRNESSTFKAIASIPNNIFEKEIPKPENWEQEITELENYFSHSTLPSVPVKLNPYSTIIDIPLFIHSHLYAVRAEYGKRSLLPCLERLKELKIFLTKMN